MSLKIVSSEKFFNAYIETFQSDNAISPGESIKIRKSADQELEFVLQSLRTHVNDVLKRERKPDFDWSLKRLQMLCDIMAEDLQALTKLVRNADLDEDTITSIRSAIEHQLTYVVFAHNASMGRVKALEKR